MVLLFFLFSFSLSLSRSLFCSCFVLYDVHCHSILCECCIRIGIRRSRCSPTTYRKMVAFVLRVLIVSIRLNATIASMVCNFCYVCIIWCYICWKYERGNYKLTVSSLLQIKKLKLTDSRLESVCDNDGDSK